MEVDGIGKPPYDPDNGGQRPPVSKKSTCITLAIGWSCLDLRWGDFGILMRFLHFLQLSNHFYLVPCCKGEASKTRGVDI